MVPPVRPKAWNIGIALNAMSLPLKSITDDNCAQFVSTLRWLSTTPLGLPSEPLVNSTTQAESGGTRAPGSLRAPHASRLARSFARSPIASRRSSSQMKRTSPAIRSTTFSNRPFSTNVLLDTTQRAPAARQADSMFAAPAVTFSRHGTTPKACKPNSVTTEPTALGSSNATCVSPGIALGQRAARAPPRPAATGRS